MRKTYIDNIRWITVVLVVIYHVIYMFNGVTTYGVMGPFSSFQLQDGFLYVVYPWFMFLLFIVSGMSARYELDAKGEKGFIKNRTRRYLVPSTLGIIAFGWILGYYNLQISGAFASMGAMPKPILVLIMMASGIGPLWYIQMLWLFSVLLIPLRKVEKDRLYHLGEKVNTLVLFLLFFAVYGAAQILNVPYVVVYRFGIYGLGFLLGFYVFSHDAVMEKMEKQWLLFTILGIGLCIVFVAMYWGQPYPEHSVLDTLFCNLYAWFGSLGILSFMKKWGNVESSFTKWMGSKSWGLYVFHYLPIAMCTWYLRLPAAAMYAVCTIASFGGALLLYEVFSRIPILRWCVLGIKKG